MLGCFCPCAAFLCLTKSFSSKVELFGRFIPFLFWVNDSVLPKNAAIMIGTVVLMSQVFSGSILFIYIIYIYIWFLFLEFLVKQIKSPTTQTFELPLKLLNLITNSGWFLFWMFIPFPYKWQMTFLTIQTVDL